jgi:nucleoid-associated protein YgaU
MRKDLKIGVFVGTGLAICIGVVLSTRTTGSLRSRLQENRKHLTSQPFIIIDDAAPPDNTEQPAAQIPATDSPKKQRIHTVVPGETLSSIAMDYYGTNDYSRINAANALDNPERLTVGTKLIIPQ